MQCVLPRVTTVVVVVVTAYLPPYRLHAAEPLIQHPDPNAEIGELALPEDERPEQVALLDGRVIRPLRIAAELEEAWKVYELKIAKAKASVEQRLAEREAQKQKVGDLVAHRKYREARRVLLLAGTMPTEETFPEMEALWKSSRRAVADANSALELAYEDTAKGVLRRGDAEASSRIDGERLRVFKPWLQAFKPEGEWIVQRFGGKREWRTIKPQGEGADSSNNPFRWTMLSDQIEIFWLGERRSERLVIKTADELAAVGDGDRWCRLSAQETRLPARGTTRGSPMMCWVAREVYGSSNPRWLRVREWVINDAPSWVQEAYREYGKEFAAMIHERPAAKCFIRAICEAILATSGR